jgi:hypothetical protein
MSLSSYWPYEVILAIYCTVYTSQTLNVILYIFCKLLFLLTGLSNTHHSAWHIADTQMFLKWINVLFVSCFHVYIYTSCFIFTSVLYFLAWLYHLHLLKKVWVASYLMIFASMKVLCNMKICQMHSSHTCGEVSLI